jgi:hypothetical protein
MQVREKGTMASLPWPNASRPSENDFFESADEFRREQTFGAPSAFQNRRPQQTAEQLRRARRLLELKFAGAQKRRRAEDWIREEWHDAHAVTIRAGRIL